MIRQGLFLILLCVAGTVQAMPHGCSALAVEGSDHAEGSDLWIFASDQEPRHVLAAKRPIFAASWSPDRREIAFSVVPTTTDFATEVVIAEVTGRVIGRFKVDRPQSELGLRYIDGIDWREPQALVTLGNQGPNGGYMDVWRLSKDHTRAEWVRRGGFLGGSCVVSPSMQYVACAGLATIYIFDTLAGPAHHNGSVEDQDYFATPISEGQSEFERAVEGNLTWDTKGPTLYAVRLENSKRVLTAIEKNPAAPEGWSTTDREIAGIGSDSRVVSIEVDAHGAVMLSTAQSGGGYDHRAYSLPGAAATASTAGLVARAASPTELRRPTVLKAAVGGKERLFKVLDSYCQSSTSQR